MKNEKRFCSNLYCPNCNKTVVANPRFLITAKKHYSQQFKVVVLKMVWISLCSFFCPLRNRIDYIKWSVMALIRQVLWYQILAWKWGTHCNLCVICFVKVNRSMWKLLMLTSSVLVIDLFGLDTLPVISSRQGFELMNPIIITFFL